MQNYLTQKAQKSQKGEAMLRREAQSASFPWFP